MDQTILLLVLATIGFIGAILRILVPIALAKLTKEQLSAMQMATEIGLFAAEQIYKEIGQGVDKKIYVKNFLMKKFPKITEEDMDVLIESTGKALGIFK